jgi:hypothetical protein
MITKKKFGPGIKNKDLNKDLKMKIVKYLCHPGLDSFKIYNAILVVKFRINGDQICQDQHPFNKTSS